MRIGRLCVGRLCVGRLGLLRHGRLTTQALAPNPAHCVQACLWLCTTSATGSCCRHANQQGASEDSLTLAVLVLCRWESHGTGSAEEQAIATGVQVPVKASGQLAEISHPLSPGRGLCLHGLHHRL